MGELGIGEAETGHIRSRNRLGCQGHTGVLVGEFERVI